MSTIHFIGGEKGGVGKSVCARLLSQFLLDHDIALKGFDADHSHQTLSRTYADSTRAIDLTAFEDIDTIVEAAVEDDCHIVVDLPAQSERFLHRWIDENELAELCEESGITIFLWYLVDDGRDSVQLVKSVAERYQSMMNLVVVRNYGRGKQFTELNQLSCMPQHTPADQALPANAVQVIDLPALHSNTMHRIDQLEFSFWAARHPSSAEAPHLSFMERQRVKVWLKKVYGAFDRVLSVD